MVVREVGSAAAERRPNGIGNPAISANGPRANGLGPWVFVAQDPRRGRMVVAANATARLRGVVPGMTVSQVAAMGGAEVRCIEHDPHADIEGLVALSEQLQQFSPIVGIESVSSKLWAGRSIHQPQAILLDTTGIASWFGGEWELGRAIQRWMAERRLLCCIGIADTAGAAWAIANYAYRHQVASALCDHEAGVVTSEGIVERWDWVGVMPVDGDALAYFGAYPLEALRVETGLVAKLHRLGIRTIASLMQLPRTALTSRFGDELLTRIDQCVMGREEAIAAHHAGEAMQSEIELEHPIYERDALEEMVRQGVRRLCQLLEKRGEGAFRVLCRIGMERHSIPVDEPHRNSSSAPLAHVIQLSLFQGSRDPSHLAWLLLGQLENQPPKVDRETGIRSVRIEATLTAPLQWQQNDLFGENHPRYREGAAKLIDSLSARLGRQQVVTPSIARDPLPERQVQWRPMTGMRNDGRAQETKRKLTKAPKRDFSDDRNLETRADAFLSRPTALLPKPLGIDVQLSPGGMPASVRYRGAECRVEQAVGPERIESGWWTGPTQRRDYYRIVLNTGDWWWIFRDLRDGNWYLHGSMD